MNPNQTVNNYLIMFRFMMFNVTFNNIVAISLWSVVLVEDAGIPVENHRLAASH